MTKCHPPLDLLMDAHVRPKAKRVEGIEYSAVVCEANADSLFQKQGHLNSDCPECDVGGGVNGWRHLWGELMELICNPRLIYQTLG